MTPRVRARARLLVAPGRRFLLDTHALVWWLTGDTRLSAAARRLIAQASAVAFVSAASAWEIATKVRLGKLNDPEGITDSLALHVRAQGFRELSITLEHGRLAGRLAGAHKDPFDRMLIAQALSEGLAIVSNDEALDRYGVTRVW